MTFLQKSYGDHNKVENPVFVNTSYERSNDEELEMVPGINQNNYYYYVVSYSESVNDDDEVEEHIFDDEINHQDNY